MKSFLSFAVRRRALAVFALATGLSFATGAMQAEEPAAGNLPRVVKQGAITRLLVDGKPYKIFGGELHNSSASSIDYVKPIFARLGKLNINTILAPVAWEQFEPEEERYDYTVIDGLIQQARENNMRLIVLWFASWKNAESSYAPAWVKKDTQRFPRIQRGHGDKPEVLSPLGENTRESNAKAFAAMMRRIKEVDSKHRTVIMVQVENEAGILRDSRDRSAPAEAAFAKPVPADLMTYLQANKDGLLVEVRRAWERSGFKTTGTWSELFGEDADEFFMAWHMAGSIEHVAARGKAVYPLPMFVNAWIVQTTEHDIAKELVGFAGGQKAGQYPSGGPVSKVHDIYRAAAPHIDLLAPDIYLPNFKAITASYTRSNNALFIPEARNEPEAVAKAFYAFGQHDALGFAPFGIDNLSPENHLVEGYKILQGIAPLIEQGFPQGKVVGILQEKAEEKKGETVRLGGYDLNITYDNWNTKQPGYGIVISTAPDEYVIAGAGLVFSFSAATPGPKFTRMLQIDEGRFFEGKWMPGRRINGDESNHNSRLALGTGAPVVRKVKLYRYE